MSTATVTADTRWMEVVGGVAALIFGIAAVFWPGITLLVLLYLFSAYVLIAGVINIMHGLGDVSVADTWFLSIVLGLFEVGVGVYLLRHPLVAFATLILLIGFVLIASGIVEGIAAYIADGWSSKSRAIGYLVALASLAAGIVVLFASAKHGVAFVWLLGIYGIIVGTLKIASLSPRDLERDL